VIPKYCAVLFLYILCCSCEKEAAFSFTGADEKYYPLYTTSRKAGAGFIPLTKKKKYIFNLTEYAVYPDNQSLEIDYRPFVSGKGKKNIPYQIALRIDNDESWILPLNLDFIGEDIEDKHIRYAIPLGKSRVKTFQFDVSGGAEGGEGIQIDALRVVKRRYGIEMRDESVAASPFAGAENDGKNKILAIDVPELYAIRGEKTLFLKDIEGALSFSTGGNSYEYIANRGKNNYHDISVPSAFIGDGAIAINGTLGAAFLAPNEISFSSRYPPITADMGFVLSYPQDKWRRESYEVFRWESFPTVLIFDTKDYAVQERLFKRLAFFAEKKGFRGRLATDGEIAELHGWNAHDYNAQTLARFFDAVKKSSFPILEEERELCEMLAAANIIKENENGFSAGEGAIVSVSRQSPDYLRKMFMAHEGFHGIFFVDEQFREFSKRRWDGLDSSAKRFILSYFDYQQYDTADAYLVVNEFMAHVLQQGASGAAKYFGETLALRIDASPWRRVVLPKKDEEAGNWPSLAESFKREAEAFSAYTRERWGLSAGRVWRVIPEVQG
jgi:hypothetical protein